MIRRILVCAMLMITLVCFGRAQDSADDDPVNGDFEDGVYTNDVFSFTLKAPPDWAPATDEGRKKYSEMINAGASDIRVLLMLFHPAQPKPGQWPDALVVFAAKSGTNAGVSLAGAVKYLKERPKMRRSAEVIRPAAPFLMGGLLLARQDYHTTSDGHEQFSSDMAILIRDRLISFQLYSTSAEGLESDIRELGDALEFKPDWSARSLVTTAPASAWVRVAQDTADRLIDKKVLPQIPDSLYGEQVRDVIQMHVQVAPNGAVERIWVYEGNPLLSWPAVQAVRQWHFKSYLANGKSVPFETTLAVGFSNN